MRKKLISNPGSPQSLVPVWFEFTDAAATTVCLAGTFNDWHPDASPMLAWGAGRWLKEMSLPADNYEYCLVVDGKYIPDPNAKETVPNPFGGKNSVLNLGNN